MGHLNVNVTDVNLKKKKFEVLKNRSRDQIRTMLPLTRFGQQQYHVVLMSLGSAGTGFGFWLTGKLGCAWHRCMGGAWVGARRWLGGRGRGIYFTIHAGPLCWQIFMDTPPLRYGVLNLQSRD